MNIIKRKFNFLKFYISIVLQSFVENVMYLLIILCYVNVQFKNKTPITKFKEKNILIIFLKQTTRCLQKHSFSNLVLDVPFLNLTYSPQF